MDIITTIKKIVAPIHRRVMLMICRGVVTMLNDTKNMQRMQVSLLDGEVSTLERYQDYGFTSNPPVGSEVVAVFVGGNRDNGIIIKCDNREHRLKLAHSEDVGIYDTEGDSIILEPSSGKITITASTIAEIKADDVNLGNGTTQSLMTDAYKTALETYLTALQTLTIAVSSMVPATISTAVTAFNFAYPNGFIAPVNGITSTVKAS